MSAVSTYDFLQATREKRVVDHRRVLNETTKNNYFCLSKMMKTAEKKFKGGKSLKDFVIGAETSSGGYYNPHQAFSVQVKDGLTPIEVGWAYHQRHYATVDEETDLNDGDEDAFVDQLLVQEGGCVVGAANDWEEALFATPDKTTMEDAATETDAKRPYSLLAIATRDGLAPSSSNGGVSAAGNWTTVQTINPSTSTWWKNQFNTYSASDPNAMSGGLIGAFDEMLELTMFDNPDMFTNYVDSLERQLKCILTNTNGVPVYKEALRANNDRMGALNDPTIRGPQFEGIPIKKVSQLDAQGWTDGNPDYLWVDLGYVVPFFHTGHYFKEKVTPGGVDHPNKNVVWKFTWHNMLCRSRRRLGRTYAA